LIAGKLEEYDSHPNLEFEPKTLTEEDIVDSGTDETITITELDKTAELEVQIAEKIETIIVSDIEETLVELPKKSKSTKSTKKKK
jgi:hypothetical protein